MADLAIPQNDAGYYLNFTVQDSTGTAYNLTDYTIKLKVWTTGRPATLFLTGTCSIVVAASGTCRYLVATTDFPNKDVYSAELELTKTGIVESANKFSLEVTESG